MQKQAASYVLLPSIRRSSYPSIHTSDSNSNLRRPEGTLMSALGSTEMRACQLPAAVELELAQLERRHDQRADPLAQRRLAELGEAAAVRVLQRIGRSRQPVQNLSAYIQWVMKHDSEERAAAGGSVPSQRGGDAVLGTVNHHIHISLDLPIHATINAGSPARSTHYSLQLPGSPGHGPVSGLQHQVGTESLVRHAIASPTTTVSSPSPVRNIVKSLHQLALGGLPRTVGAELATPPTPVHMMPADPLVNANTSKATANLHMTMMALGELEFDKVFLIYVYLGRNKTEDVCELREDYIRSLPSLSMKDSEPEIWHRFGHKFVAESDRRKNLDWGDSSKARVYHCCLEIADGSVVTIFKGPYLETSRNKLQKVVGDDNILVVKFSDIPGQRNFGNDVGAYYSVYHKVAEDGISLGLRRYRYLIHKDGGKEGKLKEGTEKFSSGVKCYFLRTESGWNRDDAYILSNKTIDEARKLFMHVHTVPTLAKYLARFALVLSKATTLLDANDLSKVNVIIIEDIPCKDRNGNIVLSHGEPLIHTDGTGLISEDIANKCPTSVVKGNFSRTPDLQPLLLQIRMFYNGLAVKGTLLVDRRLLPGTIKIRQSMIKTASDPNLRDEQSFNSLEIVSTSKYPKRAFTSRFLIALLHYGGVPADYFLELVRKALKDVEKACHKASYSLEVAYNHANLDDSMSARMILSGIQPEDDAYLQYQLAFMTREEREGIKLGRIPIEESYYLMGTSDPTGTLKPNEVCVIHENGQISGDVLVYTNPGLHFGDIHVLTATPIPNLEKEIVGFSKYVIIFPISGPRSLADEMANSDFDGDMYFVSRNPQLLEHFRPSEAWVPRNPPKKVEQKNPQHYDGPQLESLLFKEFLKSRFVPSYTIGTAADCWLVYMDQLLAGQVQENKRGMEIKDKTLDLVDIYYESLDAPKTGIKVDVPDALRVKKYPHYMEKGDDRSYHSTSVLGQIYDEAKALSEQSKDIPPINISPLACFTEVAVGVTKERKEEWKRLYDEYRGESTALCDKKYNKKYSKEERDAGFTKLYQKYRRMLYDAEEFDDSLRNYNEVFGEACAIYQIVYEYARRQNKATLCGFAWKVAGRALCHLHAIKRGGETVLCSQSVLRDAFKKNR
ncbi:probable RNA-dependent RNA polymerase 3 [Triticum aestivum]|uniref:probable RNA-dependent RNA polymerase 3 n=1 Tax=Triticum aestivum TaxID=4565 RepID=UPI001D01460A|nr:probable RNA-dependent RNA polymerase 3 [Triticum aestivum]